MTEKIQIVDEYFQINTHKKITSRKTNTEKRRRK